MRDIGTDGTDDLSTHVRGHTEEEWRRVELPSAAEVKAIAAEAGLEIVDPAEPLPPGAIVKDYTGEAES